MKSTCSVQVRGYELDSFGHVNNAVYLQYAETAKWDFFHIFQNEETGQKVCKVTGKLVFVDENEVICNIPETVLKYMENQKS